MTVMDNYTVRENPPSPVPYFQLGELIVVAWMRTRKHREGEQGKDFNMINAHEFFGHQENCPGICLFNLYSDLKN